MNKFPNGTPKQPRADRKTLLVALAALQLVNSGANAVEKKPGQPQTSWVGKVKPAAKKAEGTPKLKKLPTLAVRPKRRLPQLTEAETIDGFAALAAQFKGKHLKYGGAIQPLRQYDEFCRELSIFCDKFANHRDDEHYEADFTLELFAKIVMINRQVHADIAEKEDLLLYKTEEKWTMPFDAGDCEDFVLEKMARFLDAGLAPSTLHIIVVRDEKGAGHAVLGIDVYYEGKWNTIVLDNKTANIITLDSMEKKYEGSLMSFVVRHNNGEKRVQFFNYKS